MNATLCPNCNTKYNPTLSQCWKCGLDFATNKLPAQSPRDIARIKSWKVYFWFMTVFGARSLLDVAWKPSLIDVSISIFDVFFLVALYGFCFKKQVGLRSFWKTGFCVCLLGLMLFLPASFMRFIHGAEFSSTVYAVIYIVALFLDIPLYVAAYLYAFKRNDIWGEGALSK